MKEEKYRILLLPSGQRDLDQIEDRKTLSRIKDALIGLKDNPRPRGSIKLFDKIGGYRIRAGDYRCCYRIDDEGKCTYIYRIKHRKDVYR